MPEEKINQKKRSTLEVDVEVTKANVSALKESFEDYKTYNSGQLDDIKGLLSKHIDNEDKIYSYINKQVEDVKDSHAKKWVEPSLRWLMMIMAVSLISTVGYLWKAKEQDNNIDVVVENTNDER